MMQTSWTWRKLKRWHVQFKILDRATLLASQKDAEKHRNLIVRIVGDSTYFVHLPPPQRAKITPRTGERLVEGLNLNVFQELSFL